MYFRHWVFYTHFYNLNLKHIGSFNTLYGLDYHKSIALIYVLEKIQETISLLEYFNGRIYIFQKYFNLPVWEIEISLPKT